MEHSQLAPIGEQLPDKVEFLSRLCMKHGAPPNQWQQPGTQVLTYHALEIFTDEDYGRCIIVGKPLQVGPGGATILGSVIPPKSGLIYGGYKIKEGTKVAPGAIVTPDSDLF